MTWNWSHTQEAYDNVYYNISQLPLETLQVIAAEIKTFNSLPCPEAGFNFDKRVYDSKLAELQDIPADILVDFIYEFAAEQTECTDGGHEAYICPYNCHTVSFSKE